MAALRFLPFLAAFLLTPHAQTQDAPSAQALATAAAAATPEQAKQIADAIDASPPLAAQLAKLAADKILKGFDIVSSDDERLNERGATVAGGHFLLTAKFLSGQPPHRRVDAKKGDLDPPDNLIFSLGHLSYHLAYPLDPKSLPTSLDGRTNAVVRDEAQAMIQGWNDLVDAEAKMKGRPITLAEARSLVPNFKYREYIIKAQGKGAMLGADGHMAPEGRNVGSMTAALLESSLADFQ